ncbi:MAG: bifunctional hydroxymethylpyrimidine kinase/phosphomethylpyrimidine kinase [Sandaracinus sp.]|nr:bifunctional hydroxymethylpyrimidine kinase/phosphomethylpyrimidine kinase [Sandaracinus sp.]|tara:strand:- start:8639 stop:9409 length:771 start_codon:yes stop_codon:yes gene_type:complete
MTVALTIAGSDPSGGAGLQADLKTFHQHQVYGTSVVTLLTVQNTQRVSRVEVLEPDLVVEQLRAVLEDLPVRAAKTGALGSARVVRAVAEQAATFAFPVVVDPVMISKHGAPLMDADAQAALTELLARATLITPNAPEAEALTGRTIRTVTDARRAASELAEPGCSVLLKGGHLEGDAVDVLLHEGTFHELHAERIATRHTHGTGCTYASAITARLARGDDLVGAVHGAKAWLHRAIATAPEFGGGNGPVNHLTPL